MHGDGRTGRALVDQVDYVAFTGSTAVGREVGKRAAERLIPHSLELGGKDPLIVMADADIEQAASGVLRGALENAGQVCVSTERVYVEEPIYDQFVERLRHWAEKLTVGNEGGFEVHVGSMTSEREMLRAENHIKNAVEKGAAVIYGGDRRPDLGPYFLEPTILVNVDHTMDIMQEETFGPLIPIMRVRDVDEALRLANDSEYGLSGAIFTRDLKRGEALATRIDSGDVSINRPQFVAGTPSLPWGGQKNSGIGRRGGPEGLMRFVAPQSILTDSLRGSLPALGHIDPITLRLILLLRRIRRYVSFI
jgi:aldehyde dehydrogenase (NAD+)/succinate-semialdehyde dehydrogenase/glutarate-semialdehyde dehydrogenase